jgi:hypothetical protein
MYGLIFGSGLTMYLVEEKGFLSRLSRARIAFTLKPLGVGLVFIIVSQILQQKRKFRFHSSVSRFDNNIYQPKQSYFCFFFLLSHHRLHVYYIFWSYDDNTKGQN